MSLRTLPGVARVHDLHIWTLTSGVVAMSGHVETTGRRAWPGVLADLSGVLRERFGIAHVTVQPEPAGSVCRGPGCCLAPEAAVARAHRDHSHRH